MIHDKYNLHDLYDLVAAVRGCDMHEYNPYVTVLKEEITARIRTIVFGSDIYFLTGCHVAMTVITHSTRDYIAQSCASLKEESGAIWNNIDHYRNHLARALKISRKHPIWGGEAEYLADLLQDRISDPNTTTDMDNNYRQW